MILIKNGNIYNPMSMGKQDILTAGHEIEMIEESIQIHGVDVEIIDATDKIVIPGLIDSHVHVCGGGGEGGYHTRTPELNVKDMITAGVTTVIGILGTDGTTRTMSNLLAKVYAIENEGLHAYAYTGSYQVPVRTVTGSITDDIVLIEKIIGTGELALSDHRSTNPTLDELIRAVSETRLGGILSGKAGVVNLHMGDMKDPLHLLDELFENTMIPKSQILPTHMARNPEIFEKGLEYAKQGGFIDFTTSSASKKELSAAHAIQLALNENVPISQMTISSDGQGSLPVFNEQGEFQSLTYATCRTLLECIQSMVLEEGIDLEIALQTATSNVSKLFKFDTKGHLAKGYEADIVVLDQDTLEVDTVICKGKILMKNKELFYKSPFEK